jgi:hypothetical protein
MSEDRRLYPQIPRLLIRIAIGPAFIAVAALISVGMCIVGDLYDPSLNGALATILTGNVAAALGVWLAIRIVNIRKMRLGRGAWTAVGMASALLLYAMSFGPACRLCEEEILDGRATWIAYRPMAWMAVRAPDPISDAIWTWVGVFRVNDQDSPAYPLSREWHIQNPGVNVL